MNGGGTKLPNEIWNIALCTEALFWRSALPKVDFLLHLSLSMPPPPPNVVRCQINCYLHHPYFSTLSLMILCVCALLCRQFQPILFRANSGSTSLIYYDCHSNWSTIFHSSDNKKIKCSYVLGGKATHLYQVSPYPLPPTTTSWHLLPPTQNLSQSCILCCQLPGLACCQVTLTCL